VTSFPDIDRISDGVIAGGIQIALAPGGLFAQIRAKFLELARQNKGRAVRR
jgi:hypothetical protein